MVSLLTALCDKILLSFMSTSNFISTLSFKVYFLENTAHSLEPLLFFYGTVAGHQNPIKDQKSSREIGVNIFPKPSIISWLPIISLLWSEQFIALQ